MMLVKTISRLLTSGVPAKLLCLSISISIDEDVKVRCRLESLFVGGLLTKFLISRLGIEDTTLHTLISTGGSMEHSLI